MSPSSSVETSPKPSEIICTSFMSFWLTGLAEPRATIGPGSEISDTDPSGKSAGVSTELCLA